MVRCFGLAAAVPTSMIVRPTTSQIPLLWCLLIVRSPFRSWTSRGDVHAPPAHEHPEQSEARPDVPVVAARLAHVGVGNPHVRVTIRLEEQLLPQPPVRLLDLAPLFGLAADGAGRRGQPVANPVELSEVEQLGCGDAAADGRPLPVRDDRGSKLGLEPRDLLAQRPARGGLVDVRENRNDGRTGVQLNGHGQPPIGALGFAPQKIWVPSIPTRWTITVLSTIDLAVAVPTPTGPPPAV